MSVPSRELKNVDPRIILLPISNLDQYDETATLRLAISRGLYGLFREMWAKSDLYTVHHLKCLVNYLLSDTKHAELIEDIFARNNTTVNLILKTAESKEREIVRNIILNEGEYSAYATTLLRETFINSPYTQTPADWSWNDQIE